MKFQISLGTEKRNLLQSAGGWNHTSGLTLISLRAPINWCTKYWTLWLELRALWSYWVERAGFGLQFEESVKCNSSIQNGPSWWIAGLQSGPFLLSVALGAIFPFGSIVPVHQCVTTSNVEMGKFTQENFLRGNHEPLCLLCCIYLVQGGGFSLNYSSWLMGKCTRLPQTGLGVPRKGDSWREQMSDSSAQNSAPGSVWEFQARTCALGPADPQLCLAG